MSDLPRFKFHPNPIATGSVILSDRLCVVCNRSRHYICTHESSEDAAVCPWCLADGSAAKRLDSTFVDVCYEFESQDMFWPDEAASEQLFRRTPAFESWQGPFWLSHCGEVCEFHGEVTGARFAAIPEEVFEASAVANPLLEVWQEDRASYQKGSDIAVYEFRCRKCAAILLGADAC